ncbi:uncharacterized protein PV09_07799 [Verruconis gallopava]|uniref:Phosphoinositide phospholipase C n=1 Tax=Verruconis gallopava TaxID=253628 RepID=A0A0D1XEJ4_9PEZI|nr:uncharacterized protein PV09_07799 [Verruconis gallopava]KIW00601.1 hypothetical protein PV09_07799 [Verruconis gallopava]
MDALSAAVSNFKPFRNRRPRDDEDEGETTDHPLAGGGHAGRETERILQVRVSTALRHFLVDERILAKEHAGLNDPDHQHSQQLRRLLLQPHAIVPPELTDRSHPLQDYFVSSSHNTYLLAHQLYGKASAEAYEEHLKAGARCVEIDAWDGEDNDEPKVTHGWTLTQHIPFKDVCETIRDVVDHEQSQSFEQQGHRPSPVLISLENHCGPQGQLRMVEIMKEVFGDRLLSKPVRDKGHRAQAGMPDDSISLAELGNKIVLIVEYHFPEEKVESGEEESDLDDDEREELRRYRKKKEEAAPSAIIIPELSELGVYAQSVKPPSNAWFEKGILDGSPHHPLINISETGLASHLPTHAQLIAQHNSNHLMRVYPKGTRVSSGNLNPVPFWNVGAQICALNWQTFGAAMQLNEALFTGTDGYVLKPTYLRQGGRSVEKLAKKRKLRLHVAGATDVPVPADRAQDGSDIKPYLTCSLINPSHEGPDPEPSKQKTRPYRQHHLTASFHHHSNPPNVDPIWNDVLEWEYEDSELAFLRLLIKSDDAFAANPKLAVAAVRLLYVVENEWVFIRMLSLKGQETTCTLLVMFEFVDD